MLVGGRYNLLGLTVPLRDEFLLGVADRDLLGTDVLKQSLILEWRLRLGLVLNCNWDDVLVEVLRDRRRDLLRLEVE